MLSLAHLHAKVLLDKSVLQDCSCAGKPAENLSAELLCGEQLLFEINMRKSLFLVLRDILQLAPATT